MRVAVWRHGLSVQTEGESSVGGGRLTSAVLRAIDPAHEVEVVGTVTRGARLPVAYRPTMDLGDFDAALVLTGPSNALYAGYAQTYERLATLRPGARAAYLQWDVALPFQFQPPGLGPVNTEAVRWYLLSQTSGEDERARGAKAVGYNEVLFEHVPCFFELAELERRPLGAHPDPIPRLAYFGSDRPGRLRELDRYFGLGGVAVDIYGRWSLKNRRRVDEWPRAKYCGTVPEGAVAEVLNRYAGTLYVADPAYVRTDFVAQRLFENATAGVPVAYSTTLQPSVEAAVEADVVAPGELARWLEWITGLIPAERADFVERQRRDLGRVLPAKERRLGSPNLNVDAALRRVLG